MKQIIAAFVIGSTIPVRAQQLQLLMPSPGQGMCYSRIYDRAHLANHPDQLITTMILEIKAKSPPRYREPNMRYRDFDFRIGLKMRGSDRLLVSGDNCDWSADRTTVHCSIACDMGQFDLSTARQPGSLMLTLDRLTFEAACGENEFAEVKAGKDDKLFRLDLASADVCFQMPKPSSELYAETYNYSCEVDGKAYPLRVDAIKNIIEWRGRRYLLTEQPDCAKYGWHAEGEGASFDFCTATKGYASITYKDKNNEVQCNQKR